MANTQKLDELVTHIVRAYTVEHGPIEFAAYEQVEAIFLAEELFNNSDRVYKVTVHQFKPEIEILRLS